jgi:hypothetical protein
MASKRFPRAPNGPQSSARGSRTESAARRGIISLWTAFILAALGVASLLVVGLWLDSSRLLHARHAAESATLAAAHSWLADDLLKVQHAPFERDARLLKSRQAAAETVQLYNTAAATLQIHKDDPECFWNTPQNTPLNTPLNTPQNNPQQQLIQPELTPTTIRISIPNAIPNSAFGLTRLLPGQPLFAASTASIEHRPAALCPNPDCDVPFLPFTILDSPTTPGLWSRLIDNFAGPDNFAWIPERQQFEPGADGIPEITFTLTANSTKFSENELVTLQLSPVSPSETIRSGLSLQSLKTLGLNELPFPSNLPSTTLSDSQFELCIKELSQAPATPRILPLSALTSINTLSLIRPVAVRLIQIQTQPATPNPNQPTSPASPSATLIFQPCILVSSLVRSSPTAPPNPHIYSVRLIE